MKPIKNVNSLTAARTEVYGGYTTQNALRASILGSINECYKMHNGHDMPEEQKGYFFDIVNKLSRLCKHPTHLDSWQDIEGYAKIIKESIVENSTGVSHADQ